MATWYGQQPGDVIVGDSNADTIPDLIGTGATLTIWSLDKATQITDLLDKNSDPVTLVTADDKGRVIFAQPADEAGSVWGKDSDDNYWLFIPNDIAERAGGGGGGAVDSVNGQTGAVSLDQDDVADGVTAKQYTGTEKVKLAGIATGATANQTDAHLKDLANATGTLALARLSPSVLLTATYSGGTAVRPTSDGAQVVLWVVTGGSQPPTVTTGTAGQYDGDICLMVS